MYLVQKHYIRKLIRAVLINREVSYFGLMVGVAVVLIYKVKEIIVLRFIRQICNNIHSNLLLSSKINEIKLHLTVTFKNWKNRSRVG